MPNSRRGPFDVPQFGDLTRNADPTVNEAFKQLEGYLRREVLGRYEGIPGGFSGVTPNSIALVAVAGTEAAGWPGADHVHATPLAADGDLLIVSSSALARLAVGAESRSLEVVSGLPAWVTRALSRGGALINSGGLSAVDVVVWRAPFACTVTAVKGYRADGTGATINARLNGTSEHLASDLSLTSGATWMDGGAVQNTAYVAGDSLEIRLKSVTGAPTQVVIQVDFTRP